MMTNDESVAGVARLTAQGGSSHRPASDVDESARPITELETPSLPRSRRPVASRVRHGQPSCADYGCTRAQCVEAARKARRERSLERLQGRVGHVDSASACGYVSLLRDRGMSAQDIADRSGVSVTLVRRLLKQAGLRPGRIARATEEAVLGVPVPAPHQSMLLAGRGLVDASNVTWLLTDLARRGWPASRLARTLRVNPRTVSAIRDGRHARVSLAIERRIRRMYASLAQVDPAEAGVRPGDAARTRAGPHAVKPGHRGERPRRAGVGLLRRRVNLLSGPVLPPLAPVPRSHRFAALAVGCAMTSNKRLRVGTHGMSVRSGVVPPPQVHRAARAGGAVEVLIACAIFVLIRAEVLGPPGGVTVGPRRVPLRVADVGLPHLRIHQSVRSRCRGTGSHRHYPGHSCTGDEYGCECSVR